MRRFFGKMCFGVSAWCLAAAMCVCGASAAETPSQRLRATVDQVLLVLQEPEYRNPATRAPLRAKIERQVRTVFDFEEFSARTVGKSWPSFTAEQKKRFDDAFAELLLVTYLDKIQGYNGEQVMYTGKSFLPAGIGLKCRPLSRFRTEKGSRCLPHDAEERPVGRLRRAD